MRTRTRKGQKRVKIINPPAFQEIQPTNGYRRNELEDNCIKNHYSHKLDMLLGPSVDRSQTFIQGCQCPCITFDERLTCTG